ncbi:MAG: DUF2007 domain-containing protein [Bacteroides sp.]|nr:DUF2007 domain-containing protein [Bacteroides sp.]
MKEDKSKLVKVFTGVLWKAELLRTYLADNGISSVTQNGTVVNIVLPSTNIDVVVWVNECDYDAAIKLVQAFEEGSAEA